MRVPDAILKCVGFIAPADDPERFIGTAFVVGDEALGVMRSPCLVTAKHVAIGLGGKDFIISMNGKDGYRASLLCPGDTWFYHPTEPDSVDVAAVPFSTTSGLDHFDVVGIPTGMFIHEGVSKDQTIGPGDELFIVGLFTKFFGSSRLTPVVRTGNVAMMPVDRVPVANFGNVDAYLAEGRSIGGLSGSPAFVRGTETMPGQSVNGEVARLSGLGAIRFFGLIHGHWDLPMGFSEAQRAEAVNMGMSIIIPARKIKEVLNHPELERLRGQNAAGVGSSTD